MEAADKIIESGVSSKRVYIMEVMGKYCGYLALLGSIASGADRVYLHENGISMQDLQCDIDRLKSRFSEQENSSKKKQHHFTRTTTTTSAFFVRNEASSDVFTTDFICSLFESEGKSIFEVRKSLLGHLQQGGRPTGEKKKK